MSGSLGVSRTLADVNYEICGRHAHHAHELEKRCYEMISLNIGNPGLFGFRTPDTIIRPPDAAHLREVFSRIDSLLNQYT